VKAVMVVTLDFKAFPVTVVSGDSNSGRKTNEQEQDLLAGHHSCNVHAGGGNYGKLQSQ
jgi:hypothetical protein